MAHDFKLSPSASSLSASMRDLGYSLESAVADLIDNSISAGSTYVQILCGISVERPYLVLIDNGRGMDAESTIAAMRHGSTNPNSKRAANDLGRFGLGLKTASFSQCRSLTVVSKKRGSLCGAEWNLDRIDREDEWLLSILDQEDLSTTPFISTLGESGTLVLWRDLDRLMDNESGNRAAEIVNEKLDLLGKHLALVFHRYISGEYRTNKSKLKISVNGHEIAAFDPFCQDNPATQRLPEEIVRINGFEVTMQPFILPHHSRLTPSSYDFYQSRSDFISNQGAYVYRNGRLMAWGDWFRIIPKGETTKLARVQIDFPNALDEAWTIDIKKSRARPPNVVRERLRQIIARVSERSAEVHRGRGKRLFSEVTSPLWDRFADQNGIRYAINKSHPLVENMLTSPVAITSSHIQTLLEAIASSIPVEMIYADYSTHPTQIDQEQPGDVLSKLASLYDAVFGLETADANVFRSVITSTRMFERQERLVDEFIARNFK